MTATSVSVPEASSFATICPSALNVTMVVPPGVAANAASFAPSPKTSVRRTVPSAASCTVQPPVPVVGSSTNSTGWLRLMASA